MLDKKDPASEVRFQQQHRFPLDGVGRPDSNLQDQGTPSLVVGTHFEVRVGVEEPRHACAQCAQCAQRAVDDYIYSDLGSRIGFGYSNSELSI